MSREIELINALEKSGKWVGTHYEKLRKAYPNQFIAVKGSKVIVHDRDPSNVLKKLEKMKEDVTTVLIQFIPEKGVEILY